MEHQEALTAYIAAFVSELVQTGITEIVVSPGSRSTPMAMVMAEHPDLHLHIHVDERSAAFFALGMAKTLKKPVAILCTSGTATANYYPAIIEASYSRIPLVVLTSDRPHELREVGAPQAINQIHLYGQHVKWFVEMPLPEKTTEIIRYARSTCARAVSTATAAPAGPVHLNFPFREPLIPKIDMELFQTVERHTGYVKIHHGSLTVDNEQLKEIASRISGKEKGIIICGSIETEGFAEAVTKLASALNFPILADPLSQLRSGKHDRNNIIETYDTFLRNEDAKSYLKPDIVIRFGAMPVSKALTIFLKENHSAEQIVIDGGGGWRDPSALSTDMVFCNETIFCKSILGQIESNHPAGYIENWKSINNIARNHMTMIGDVSEISESRLFYQLSEMLPENATLFVGNSMPIRDVDSFFLNNEKNIKVMANRGANGIDGTVSTALGAALYSQPLYLVLGDLTFFHDLNGLLAAKLYGIDIHIIVINNNGGGIFSFLPQAEHAAKFELLFGTPLNLEFEHVVKMYNGSFAKIENWDEFRHAMQLSTKKDGLNVYEISTNRDRNTLEHREFWNSVSREISNFVKGDHLCMP